MTRDNSPWPVSVTVLSDGVRGHLHQSLGVAEQLSSVTGASVFELKVPRPSGLRRIVLLKLTVLVLPRGGRTRALNWLRRSGREGLDLLCRYRRILGRCGSKGEDSLIVSAGSSAAPYTLALSRITGARCCTLMTPSVLGAGAFDYSIVPFHDGPAGKSSLQTLGAPNSINRDFLAEKARDLLRSFPAGSGERWAVLVGGDDRNYVIPPDWADRTLGPLLEAAGKSGASLYITTSRRTPKKTEERIESLCRGDARVAMVLLASKTGLNPVPGMLGACTRVFCTEDSVSMISEAATAGFVVCLLRTTRRRGPGRILQEVVRRLTDLGILPEKCLFGVPRFDGMIRAMKRRGLLAEMPEDRKKWSGFLKRPLREGPAFNEAQRAALWIKENRR